jgi:tetratricopeptide (TPR) repeat protein
MPPIIQQAIPNPIRDQIALQLLPATPIWFAFAALTLIAAAGGCQSFQNRMSQRCARCGALCAQAREAREQGNSERANEFINAALRQKPDDFETRRQLAETMWISGRQTEAIQEFSLLCADHPPDAKLAGRLAAMQWEAGQTAAATRTAGLVLQLDPQSKDALLIKARSEAAAGKLDDALNSYVRLTQIAPDEVSALIELGELQVKRNQPDRARPLLQTVLEHPRTTAEQRTQAQWLIGVAYARGHRWSSALPMLETAMPHRNLTAEDLCLLAATRYHCGDTKQARSDVEHALQADPASTTALKLQKQLAPSVDIEFDKSVTPASHNVTQ